MDADKLPPSPNILKMALVEEESRERRRRFRRSILCNYVGIALGILVAAPIGIMLLDRREPITLHSGQIVPDTVRPGQTVTVLWRVTENRPCDGEVARRVVDSSGKIHEFRREPTVYHLVGERGVQTFSGPFTMPDGMVDGPAYYTTSGYRWCNVLQKLIWPIPFQGPRVTFNVQSSKPLSPEIQRRIEDMFK